MKVPLYNSIIEKIQTDASQNDHLISSLKNNCSINQPDDQKRAGNDDLELIPEVSLLRVDFKKLASRPIF